MEEAQEPPALSLLDLPSHVLDAVFSLALRLHQDALAHAEDGEVFDVRKRDPRRCVFGSSLPPLPPPPLLLSRLPAHQAPQRTSICSHWSLQSINQLWSFYLLPSAGPRASKTRPSLNRLHGPCRPLLCRVLPLVSRGFLAAANASHTLWRRVQLNLLALSAERVPSLVAWLSRHAAMLRCLSLHGGALPTVEAALLGQLVPLAAAIQAAGQAGLEALELPRPLGAAVLALLDPARLPRLRVVAVDLAPCRRPASGGSVERLQEWQQRRASNGLGEAQRATLCLLHLPALEELLAQSNLDVSWGAVDSSTACVR